jgi:hypothetical protein
MSLNNIYDIFHWIVYVIFQSTRPSINYNWKTIYDPMGDRSSHFGDAASMHKGIWYLTRNSAKNRTPTFVWYDTDRIKKTPPTFLRCRGNVFTQPLHSNNRDIYTYTEREREKRESGGRQWETLHLRGEGKKTFSTGFEGSQVVPACPARGMFERRWSFRRQ